MKITLLKKVEKNIKKIALQKSPSRVIIQAFEILGRRNVPVPSAFIKAFDKPSLTSEKFLERHMVPEDGMIAIDIGAHVGLWASFLAEKGVEVHAFEPNIDAYRELKDKSSKYHNLRAYSCALGEASYNANYDSKSLSITSGNTENSAKCLTVSVRTLDSFHFKNVGVIKIDTEGYEYPILNGAKATIAECRPRLVVEIHKGTGQACKEYGDELRRIMGLIKEHGYAFHIENRLLAMDEMQPFLIALPLQATAKSR